MSVPRDCAAALAAAITAAVPASVPVTDHPPDTTAGAAVWLRYLGRSWIAAGAVVAHEVVLTVDPALTGKDAADQLGALEDAVYDALEHVAGVAPRDVFSRTAIQSVGDLGQGAVVVTVSQLNPFC